MLDAGELPGWVQKMMGHESLKMILERYYSYIKNYQRDDGSAFMDNVYNPSIKQDDEMPSEDEKSENFTPCFARASMFGVSISLPKQPASVQPISSAMTNRKFGRFASA